MRKKGGWSVLLLLLSAALIALGWRQNQQSEVWTKAARICLECIGIG